jgi:EmrB/QacA subfamily drug resistance transporter
MTVLTAARARAGRGTPRRAAALAVLCAASLLVILDTTIVSVALPSIQADLGLAGPDLAWVVNAYVIPLGGLLLLCGRLGDLLGRKPIFVAGVVLFLIASMACGLATSPAALVAARAAQGVGGALATAVTLGLLVRLFPEPGERARAIAIYGATGALGASVGVVAGGVLTEALSWHWIFFVNLPAGVAVAVAAARVLDSDRGLGLRAGADLPGAALVVATLLVAVFAIVGTDARPAAVTAGLLAAAALLGAAFLRHERRAAAPLVPPRVLRNRALLAANGLQVVMIAGFFGQQFLVALYLQRVLGFRVLEVGLGMLPIAVLIGLVALGVAARLIGRLGARRTLVAGLLPAALGLLLLARVTPDAAYAVAVLPALVLMGVGGGLALPAVTTLVMAGAGPDDAGLASGLANTAQQVGAAVGLAVVAAAAGARTDALTAAGARVADALAGGYRLGFAISAGLVLVAAALAWRGGRGGARL